MAWYRGSQSKQIEESVIQLRGFAWSEKSEAEHNKGDVYKAGKGRPFISLEARPERKLHEGTSVAPSRG